MAFMDLDWWNETAKTANKNIKSIHESGVDAFVVFVGSFSFAADRDVSKTQEYARTLVSSGMVRRESVRIKRIKV